MFERHSVFTPRQSLMDAPLRLPIGHVIHPDEDPNAVFCEHCGADLKLNWFGPLPIPARFLECDCGGGVA